MKFNTNNATIDVFDKEHWLQGSQFSLGAKAALRSGELAFGGVNGFSIFDPRNIRRNTIMPKTTLTELDVFNERIRVGPAQTYLKKDIAEAQRITLQEKDAMFAITFAALSFRIPENNRYQYRLEGFDEHWVDAVNGNKAIYTNIGPGSYRFRVKAANNDGLWAKQDASVNVVVVPPWWKSWWAYTFLCGAVAWPACLHCRLSTAEV